MMAMNKCVFFLLFLMLASCKDKSEVKGEFKYFKSKTAEWKSKTQSRAVGELEFTAVVVPPSYYVLKDIQQETPEIIDSVENVTKHEKIVEFEFRHHNNKDIFLKEITGKSYDEGIKYMSFEIEKDFCLVTSKNDTIPCAGATFERNFKIAPYQKILLFFTGIPENDENLQLIYHDKLFQKGILKYQLKQNLTKLIL